MLKTQASMLFEPDDDPFKITESDVEDTIMLARSLIVMKKPMRPLTLTKITLFATDLSNTGNTKMCF